MQDVLLLAVARGRAITDPGFMAWAKGAIRDRLVRHAANAMQEKLQLARVKGRGGWWNSDECTIEHLRTLLREHVEKGDMRDVLNLAAMVYVREIADMRPNV